ncbi:MAG: MBL fold metallo-hydrolase [Dehalococcoidia bacterium]|nr:MBL fold metallo-hydrolase [Dehalococcoidia bacterium]MDW8120243.1 MBL fold metallo-hydrolase [Chloroflexota bacterium]
METIHQDDTALLLRVVCGRYSNNAYILACRATGEGLLIDAPEEPHKVLDALGGIPVRTILLTHRHPDHWAGLATLKSALGVPVAIGSADAEGLPFPPDILIADGQVFPFGRHVLQAIATPGHTPGSTCFLWGRFLFSGDTLFPGGPGRTRTPQDFRQIVESIRQRLLTLPEDTRVLPGHGAATTIGRARAEYAVFASRPHPPDLCGDVVWAG